MCIQKATKLIEEIKTARYNWNEYSQFTIGGVKNLSLSDLSTLIMYANSYIDSGGFNFSDLMNPAGEIEAVLNAYGIKPKFVSMF